MDEDVCLSFLADILSSEHEEAIFAATEALKNLINTCFDEGLIKQGVDRIANPNSDLRKSGPSVIEKVCATIESLLDYHYNAVWDMAFQVVSAMFDKLGIVIAHLFFFSPFLALYIMFLFPCFLQNW